MKKLTRIDEAKITSANIVKILEKDFVPATYKINSKDGKVVSVTVFDTDYTDDILNTLVDAGILVDDIDNRSSRNDILELTQVNESVDWKEKHKKEFGEDFEERFAPVSGADIDSFMFNFNGMKVTKLWKAKTTPSFSFKLDGYNISISKVLGKTVDKDVFKVGSSYQDEDGSYGVYNAEEKNLGNLAKGIVKYVSYNKRNNYKPAVYTK